MSKTLTKSFEEISARLAHSFVGADEWVRDIIMRLDPVWEKEDAWLMCPYSKSDEKDRLLYAYRGECIQLLSYLDKKYGGCDALYKKMEDDIRQRAVQYQVSMEEILTRWRLGVRGKYRECDMPIAQIDALSVGMVHSYGHALHCLDSALRERSLSRPAMVREC